MAYKPLYDEAYLKSLVSQIQKFNKKKTARRIGENRATKTPAFNFTDSQRAAVILKNIKKQKERGENRA